MFAILSLEKRISHRDSAPKSRHFSTNFNGILAGGGGVPLSPTTKSPVIQI